MRVQGDLPQTTPILSMGKMRDHKKKKKRKKERKETYFYELYFFRKDLNYIFSLCLSLNNGTHEPAILMRKKRRGVGEERHCVQCSGKRKEAKTIALNR